VDFVNPFTVALLLLLAGLIVLAVLPQLRKWQRERERGAVRDGAVRDTAGETAGGYGADVAIEGHGRSARPDQHWLADDYHPHEDQDEQMRNRPADEQHHRRSHRGGSARPRPAEEHDPRHAPAVDTNGHAYAGLGDAHDAPHAGEFNDHYEQAGEPDGHYEHEHAGEPDDGRRAAHFDWKVAAQYERARAARNASMSSFEPPPLPNDGPGTFTEEIPAIHAADGQRRHPAVQPDPDAGRQPFGRQHAAPEPEPHGTFDDPWGPETAVHPPPAFEFDEQHYDQPFEPYDEQGHEPHGFDQPVPPYGVANDQGEDDLAPPPHMRWRPDPEPDPGLIDEPPYGMPPGPHGHGPGGPPGPPGTRPAFATTFRVQPAVEEPVPVHVAEPMPFTEPPFTEPPFTEPPFTEPAAAYAPDPADVGDSDPWGDGTAANRFAAEPAPGFSDRYAPPSGPSYQSRHFDEPPGLPEQASQTIFESPVEQPRSATPGSGITSPFAEPPPPARPPLPDITPLLAEDEVAELRTRWNAIKGTFPDDPITSVQEASKLVGECTQLFERRLRIDPDDTDVSTEDLRLALQRHLAFFERLLSS
jgi:hypothetical protein